MDITAQVTQVIAGQSACWGELFNETHNMVYFTALKLLGNETVAEDITQDTYLKAMQNIGSLRDAQAFSGWLKRICVNLCKNYLSAKRPAALGADDYDATLALIPEVSEDFLPQEYLDRQENCRLVAAMVDELPEKLRLAVVMYYYDELSVAQVAETLAVSENTVKSRLNYARAYVKKKVEELEKKGTKLYSAAPVLAFALRSAAQDCRLSPAAISRISGTLAAASAATGTAAVSSGAAASAAAKTGLMAKLTALPLAVKAVSVIVAAAIVIGGGIAVIKSGGSDEVPGGAVSDANSQPDGSDSAAAPDASAQTDGFDPVAVLDMTADEMRERFGAPMQENRENPKHGFMIFGIGERLGSAEFQASFQDGEETPYNVLYYGRDVSFCGIDAKTPPDDMLCTLLENGYVEETLRVFSENNADAVCVRRDTYESSVALTLYVEYETLFVSVNNFMNYMGKVELTNTDLLGVVGITDRERYERFGHTVAYSESNGETRYVYTLDGKSVSMYVKDGVIVSVFCDGLPYMEYFAITDSMTKDDIKAHLAARGDITNIDSSTYGKVSFVHDGTEYCYNIQDTMFVSAKVFTGEMIEPEQPAEQPNEMPAVTGETIRIPKMLNYIDETGIAESAQTYIAFNSDCTGELCVTYGGDTLILPLTYAADWNEEGALSILCTYSEGTFMLTALPDGTMVFDYDKNIAYVCTGSRFEYSSSGLIDVPKGGAGQSGSASGNTGNTGAPSGSTGTSGSTATVLPVYDKVIDPELAAALYTSQRKVWMRPANDPTREHFFSLIDLDHDGMLELIATQLTDDGVINNYYRLDIDTYSVVQFYVDESGGKIDFSQFYQDPELYRDEKTGELFYYGYSHSYPSKGETRLINAALSLQNSRLVTSTVFNQHECPDDMAMSLYGQTNQDKTYYVIAGNGAGTVVDKDTFDAARDSYEDDYTDMHLSFSSVKYSVLTTGTYNDIQKRLLSAYKAFSYSGYSFNDFSYLD